MKALLNIEKSGTRKGEYVAYINGCQRVRRGGAGWQTYALGSSAGASTFIQAATLESMDRKIEALKKA